MVINSTVGVYIPIIRIPIKGGMTIPNIATFDHGTFVFATLRLFSFDNMPLLTAFHVSLFLWMSSDMKLTLSLCPFYVFFPARSEGSWS